MASPISDALSRRSLRYGEDAMIRHRSPAQITEELFRECISSVFISYVLAVRDRLGFQNEMTVLLMDSAVPHPPQRVRSLLGDNTILAISFPAPMTDLFQVLDLVFFEVLKKLKTSAVSEFDDSVNAHISKLIQAYEQTATPSTIRGSFWKAGLEHDIKIRPFKLQVIEESLRANPGFQKMRARDESIESLSRRRREQRFGIINSEFIIWKRILLNNLFWNSPFGC
jgi:hypothetical protein